VRKITLCSAVVSIALVGAIGLAEIARGDSLAAPEGLSAYGTLIWNLDALVHDWYGRGHVCVRAKRFAIHRCLSATFNDGDYRATFATAARSHFRALARNSNPLRRVNVLPIRIGRRYIQCGAGRWLAITNAAAGWGEPVDCVKA
jgi:hypothetical protein